MGPPPKQTSPRRTAGAAALRAGKTDAIVTAVYDELAATGYERLTMDRVAARAGVGKAALYRRWPSKEQMLAVLAGSLGSQGGMLGGQGGMLGGQGGMLGGQGGMPGGQGGSPGGQGGSPGGQDSAAPDHGSLRADLAAYVGEVAGVLSDPLIQRLIGYLVSRARGSAELVQALRGLPGPSRESGRAMLRRAIDRGELGPGTDIELALDLIAGPLLVHGIYPGRPLTPGYAGQLAAAVRRGLDHAQG